MALADVLRRFTAPEPPATPARGTVKTDRTPPDEVVAVLSVPFQRVEGGPMLTARVWAILKAGERHTTLNLALRLGRPRDLDLDAVRGALREGEARGTEGRECEWERRGGR